MRVTPARPRLRECQGLERLRAAADARAWGFPRDIEPAELVAGHWFRWGDHGVFWLVSDGHCELHEFAVHVACRRGTLLLADPRAWQRALVLIGDLLQADRFVAVPTIGPNARAVRLFLTQLGGWQREGKRWYLSLAEGGGWDRASRAPRAAGRSSRRRESRKSGRGPRA